MKKRMLLLVLFAATVGHAQQTVDTEEITRIMDELKQFDATQDPAVYDAWYPDEPLMLVNGRFTHPRKTSTLRELTRQREQHRNDYRVVDIGKPVISVSDDGSMAWAAVHQRRKEIDRNNGATLRTWDMSILRVFEKTPDGTWKIVTEANTGVD